MEKFPKKKLWKKKHPLDPTANAAILYREINTTFNYTEDDGFFAVTEIFERIKIYNQEGYKWATKKIRMYNQTSFNKEEVNRLKAVTYTLNKKGKIEEEKLKNSAVFDKKINDFLTVENFTMPNIQDGCVIEFKYTFKSPFISNINEFRLQETIPINMVKVHFSSPEYLIYKVHQKGWVPFKILESKKKRTMKYRPGAPDVVSDPYSVQSVSQKMSANDMKETTFTESVYETELQDVPALKQEAYISNIDNFAANIKVELSFTKYPNTPLKMFTTTWEDVSRSYYDSENFGRQIEKTNYFEDELDAVLSGINEPSEKITAIYEFVKQRMNWNSHWGTYAEEGTKNAFKTERGNTADINLMLTGMLRYAGFEANPILVSTKSNGIPLFPSRNSFNYVISGVENEGSLILLDATNKMGEPNLLNTEIINWQGRIIKNDGTSTWISLFPSKSAVQNTMLTMNISSDLLVSGNSQNRFTDHYALSYRNQYNNLAPDEVRKKLEEKFEQTKLTEIVFKNLDQSYVPVELSYEFTSEGVEEIGNKLYFSPMLFMTLTENPFKLEERKYPIDYEYPQLDRYIINITIPEGYAVSFLPESIFFKTENDIGSFKYLISQSGNNIQLSVAFSITQSLVAATEYEALKNFYEQIIKKEKEKVVLVRL